MQRRQRFWERAAERWATRPDADPDGLRHARDLTERFLTPRTEMIDLGCGTGETALRHASGAASVLALDFSHNMIAEARARGRAAGVRNVTWHHGAIEDLAPAPPRFDLALGQLILHLVKDRALVLSRIHDLLRPGGIFVSRTHCLGGRPMMRLAGPLAQAAGLAPPLAYLTPDRLVAEITAAGFEVTDRWQAGAKGTLVLAAKKPGEGAAVAQRRPGGGTPRRDRGAGS